MILRDNYTWLFIVYFLLISSSIEGKVTHATSNGNWSSSGTWDNGVPACGDSIYIDKDKVVNVDVSVNLDEAASCSTSIYLEIDGVLYFNAGRKMYLSCNSHIVITTNGELKKGPNGGSSSLIDICATNVWTAGSGDLSGPAPVGPGLPIELIEFNAKLESDVVRLYWSTASEINNDYFTIERSRDLKLFKEVSHYSGAGNSREIRHYTAYDTSPLQGISYYRLKQTDFDGRADYSNPVSITFNPVFSRNFRVYPSIAINGKLFVEIYNEEPGQAILELFTMEGRLIYKSDLIIENDRFSYIIDLSDKDFEGLVLLKYTSAKSSYESKIVLGL